MENLFGYRIPLRLRWLAATLCVAAIASACAQNPAASRGPFPGFAEYEDRPVGRVVFAGTPVLPVDSLRAVTVVQPPSCRVRFLPRSLCFTGTRRYRLSLMDLAGDVVRLQVYFRDHGYYGSRVVPTVEPMDEELVEVRYSIAPGDQVMLRSLTVEGVEGILPPEGARGRLPLKVGEPFRRIGFLATADTLRSALFRRGYAYAEVLRNYSLDTVADVAEVNYVAVPGPVVRVDSIRILGAERLDRSTILKQLPVREGEILQLPSLGIGQRNLYQLSIVSFATVELAPDSLQVDSDSTTATVAVRIVEAPRYLTEATLGYGTIDCVRAGARALDRNFLGGGRTLEVSASAAKIGVGAPVDFGLQGSVICRGLRGDQFSDTMTYRLAADFLQPRLLGTRTQLSVGVHAERQSEMTLFMRRSVGSQFSLSRDIGAGALLGTGLRVERGSTSANAAIFCVIFTACSEAEQDPLREPRWSNAATLSASLDRTRPLRLSTTGYQLRSSFAWASPLLQSDDRYLSAIGEAVAYRPLRRGWDLAGRLQLGGFLTGRIGYEAGYIPPERRFYAGGPASVRGFAPNAMGPQAYVANEISYDQRGRLEVSPQRYPLGGTQLVVGSVELRTPSPLLPQFFRFATFVDAGQLRAPGLDRGPALRGVGGPPLVVTPGVGLRVTTPVGPIRLDVGYSPYPGRRGPLYLAPEDEEGRPTGELILISNDYQPVARTFLDRLQFHIAVGQAF